MDTVVIYPGRFHPFHKGHKSVYDTLVRRFGKNRVFIATSNVVDPPKSPFTFEEKRAMIALTGIDPSRVIQTKSPYQATEITNNYDPQNTIALFAVSDKDMAEDPRFSFKPRQDGNPSYYQPAQKEMQGFDKHAYIVTVPTLQFGVLGEPMRSASEFRAKFANADERTQEKMIIDMFGKYDKKIHNIMSQKIVETLIRADEILDKLIEMGADDHYILEACRRVDALVESLQLNELKGNARLVRSPEEIDKRLTFIKPVRGLPNLITPKKPTRLMKRRAYSQMPEEITKEEAVTVKMSNGKTIDISHLQGNTAAEKAQTFNKMFGDKFKNVRKNFPNYTIHQGKNIISGLSGKNLINTSRELDSIADKFQKQLNTEEITKFNNVDPMSSVIAIRGIGTMTIPQALDKVAEMSNMIAEIAKSNDAKNVQDNVPYYMNLLKTYNESIQEAYSELAQQRKLGGTKSRGIDPDITEQKEDDQRWNDKRRLAMYNPDSETYRGTRLPGYSNSKYSDPIDNAQNLDDIANKPTDDSLDFNFDTKELKKVIAELLPKIKIEKDRKILQAYFGLAPFGRSYNFREIADALGITRMAVKNKADRALRQLKYHRDILLPFVKEDDITDRNKKALQKLLMVKGIKDLQKKMPNIVKKESFNSQAANSAIRKTKSSANTIANTTKVIKKVLAPFNMGSST